MLKVTLELRARAPRHRPQPAGRGARTADGPAGDSGADLVGETDLTTRASLSIAQSNTTNSHYYLTSEIGSPSERVLSTCVERGERSRPLRWWCSERGVTATKLTD